MAMTRSYEELNLELQRRVIAEQQNATAYQEVSLPVVQPGIMKIDNTGCKQVN